MALENANRDDNRITTLMGVDMTTGKLPTKVYVDESTHRLLVSAAITSGGGGTQYTEDAAAAADPVGTAVNLIRKDTPATITTTDGDNVAQRGTNYGAAYTQVVTSAGAFVDTFGGGTQYADGAVKGTATGTVAMGDDGTNVQSIKVDSAGELQVDVLTLPAVTGTVTANIGTVGTLATAAKQLADGHNVAVAPPTTIANGRKVVTTAGTAVVLAASTSCTKVDISAETDNTGIIVVGGSGVIAALATRQGVPLNAGDTYSLDITNLTTVYIDSTVNGDGVSYSYQT